MEERRSEPRQLMALPVKLGDGSVGVTRDISPSGIYLSTSTDHQVGQHVVFEMESTAGQLVFTAEGEIVRVERDNGVVGIAVNLSTQKLSMPAANDPQELLRFMTPP
jgi:hypothetical protein